MFTFRAHTHYVLLAMQIDGDAVQDISWPGLQAPVEAYKRKQLRAGAAALPSRGHESAEVAPVLGKGFEDGAVHVDKHGRRYSVMPRMNTTRAEARIQLRGGPPSSVLIRGTYRCTNADYATWVYAVTVAV